MSIRLGGHLYLGVNKQLFVCQRHTFAYLSVHMSVCLTIPVCFLAVCVFV